jgi:5-(hydroxymethyl)furfural/furfural oxidase
MLLACGQGPHPHSNGRARERGDELRLHHRRQRVCGLGYGQPVVGPEQQQGAAVRSRPGDATRQGAAEILDSYPGTVYFDPRFHWTELKVHTEVISHNRPEEDRPPLRKYEQARVLGGGSSINAQLANRGAPGDYDEWEARGAAGWNWNAVLPYFKTVECDMDFDGPWRGKDGRIPVRRILPDLWNGYAKAIAKAFDEAGFQYLQDQNAEFKDGYFPVTISNLYDRRVSAAIGYLDPETRRRDNLTISTLTHVKELLFEGTRSVGAEKIADAMLAAA